MAKSIQTLLEDIALLGQTQFEIGVRASWTPTGSWKVVARVAATSNCKASRASRRKI